MLTNAGFFFRVANTRKGMKVKFNLINLCKPDSLYNYGMKVLAYSEKARKEKGQGWIRAGENISYFQNNYRREYLSGSRYYFTLTFTYTFTESKDTVYFANCYPYTYSDLVDDLTLIEKNPKTCK